MPIPPPPPRPGATAPRPPVAAPAFAPAKPAAAPVAAKPPVAAPPVPTPAAPVAAKPPVAPVAAAETEAVAAPGGNAPGHRATFGAKELTVPTELNGVSLEAIGAQFAALGIALGGESVLVAFREAGVSKESFPDNAAGKRAFRSYSIVASIANALYKKVRVASTAGRVGKSQQVTNVVKDLLRLVGFAKFQSLPDWESKWNLIPWASQEEADAFVAQYP